MRAFVAAVVLFSIYAQARAGGDEPTAILERLAGNYFCTDEISVGIEWDDNARVWGTPRVELAERFVIRARYVGNVADNETGPGIFAIALTKAGTAEAIPCSSAMEATDDRPTVAAFRPIARCYEADSLREWFIDLGALRFMRIETGGFSYPGELATPSMTGGICTKFE